MTTSKNMPPVSVSLVKIGELKAVSKLVDILKSYFGVRIIRKKAQEEAEAMLIQARAKAEAKLITARSAIEHKKVTLRGAHEVDRLSKELATLGAPDANDDTIEVVLDDLWEPPGDSTDARHTIFENVEHQRLNNIKCVTFEAMKALPEHHTVSDDPVDADWAPRYFDAVKDVSRDDMRRRWGRLLAGELVRPGSFSLRTLDVLHNLSSADAQLFDRVAPFVLDGAYLVAQNDILFRTSPLNFADILRLEECGLLLRGIRWFGKSTVSDKYLLPIQCHDKLLTLDGPDPKAVLRLDAFMLTGPGREIHSLERYKADIGTLEEVGREVKQWGISATIAERDKDGI